MQTTQAPSNPLSIVWTAVFLTAISLFGLGCTVIVSQTESGLFDPAAVALLVAIAPSIFTVPLLLLTPEPDLNKLATGRVLTWLQAFALFVAAGLAITILVCGPLYL